jgi:pimeloyl-ACP methyl ester carboxylesterase
LAKSAIKHNMLNDLPKIKQPTCIIWGKQDGVTPPDVAEEMDRQIPNSDLLDRRMRTRCNDGKTRRI